MRDGWVTVHEFPFSGAIKAQACIGKFLGESGIVEGADDGASGIGAFVFQQRKNFARQFAVNGVTPGMECIVLSESASRADLVETSVLALESLGAKPFEPRVVVVDSGAQDKDKTKNGYHMQSSRLLILLRKYFHIS